MVNGLEYQPKFGFYPSEVEFWLYLQAIPFGSVSGQVWLLDTKIIEGDGEGNDILQILFCPN